MGFLTAQDSNLGPVTAITAPALLLLLFLLRSSISSRLNDLISHLLHIILCTRYPIRHVETRASLPTVKYRWPNGQGDAAKFLYGKENSLLWRKRHGSLYRIWSGSTPEIVLTKPEHVQVVFKDSDKHVKAVNNNSGYLLSQLLGECVGLISRDDWKRVRAVTEQPFHRQASSSYASLVVARIKRHFNELWTSSCLSEGIINPAQDLKMLPFWIVAEIIYGELTTSTETELKAIVPLRERLFKYVIAGGLTRFRWSRWLPTRANNDLANFQARWSAFNVRAREMALQRDGTPAPIVRMYEAVEDGSCTLTQLLQTLDEMLFANLDVTLGGMTWNLVYLAANPTAQARLRSEVAKARLESLEQEGPPFATYLNSASTYLQAVISESSRLRPLAAFSVPQSAPTSRMLDGYLVPAGTNFIIDSHSLNERNAYWGADSGKFRPERFLERKPTEARYNFWRFGFGPRQCMGKYVADLIIRALLVELVENYELALVKEGAEWERDKDVWINHPDMKLSCKKRDVGTVRSV